MMNVKGAMSPLLPIESMVGTIQFVCYFFTVLAAAFGFMLVRQ
jgi:hypothetical protein